MIYEPATENMIPDNYHIIFSKGWWDVKATRSKTKKWPFGLLNELPTTIRNNSLLQKSNKMFVMDYFSVFNVGFHGMNCYFVARNSPLSLN